MRALRFPILLTVPMGWLFASTPKWPEGVEVCMPLELPTLATLEASNSWRSAGTEEMAAILKGLSRVGDPQRSPFKTQELAELLKSRWESLPAGYERVSLRIQHAEALTRAGDTEGALAEFAEIETELKALPQPVPAAIFVSLYTGWGIAGLRRGEQQNCIGNRTIDSCLLPIRGGGVHRLPGGAQTAANAFSEILKRYPGDLRARWLLMISHMTLGDYPGAVPEAWRIPEKALASEQAFPRFPDVAASLPIGVNECAGGVIMDDFDNDGDYDLLVSAWAPTLPIRYFRNEGNGQFTDQTLPAGLRGITGGLNLVQADYNNDGFVDALVLRGAWLTGEEGKTPNSLLKNNGDGTFSDVTREAGVLSFHPTQTATWFDMDRDGWLDLFVANESSPGEEHPHELYRNNRDGTFTEMAAASGINYRGVFKGVAAGDYDADGYPDLYLSRRDGPNVLLHNDGRENGRGGWAFTDVTLQAGVREPLRSFPCWFWDYDNDGWMDIYVGGYGVSDVGDSVADLLGEPNLGERPRLFRNNRDGTFADVSASVGLDRILHAMSANFGDLDNDGWLDAYFGTGAPDLTTLLPNRMLRNVGGERFVDVTTAGGFGQIQKGHGIAFGDIDQDGDQDIYSVVGGAYPSEHFPNQLFMNPGFAGNHFLQLRLEGVKANRSAIGARIRVVVETEKGEQREIYRMVSSGGSFGASPLRAEIGLGLARRIVSVDIIWPSETGLQQLGALPMDRAYAVKEGQQPEPLPLRPFKWPAESTRAITPDLPILPRVQPPKVTPVPLSQKVLGQMDRLGSRIEFSTSPSGLRYSVIQGGGGPRVRSGDRIKISVAAYAEDGRTPLPEYSAREMDVSVDDLHPGLAEAVSKIALSGRIFVLMPPALGPEPQGDRVLCFEIALWDILPKK